MNTSEYDLSRRIASHGAKHKCAPALVSLRASLDEWLLEFPSGKIRGLFRNNFPVLYAKVRGVVGSGKQIKGRFIYALAYGESEGTCENCHQHVTRFLDSFRFARHCSPRCAHSNETVKAKVRDTLISRYGTDTIAHIPGINERRKATCRDKYGSDFYFSSEAGKKAVQRSLSSRTDEAKRNSQEKKEQTCIERFGVKHFTSSEQFRESVAATNMKNHGVKSTLSLPSVQKKIKRTMISRYGVENSFASRDIQRKIRSTFMNKYGSDHPLKNTEVFSRMMSNRFRRKDVVDRFGKQHSVQGYEHLVIERLSSDPRVSEIHSKPSEVGSFPVRSLGRERASVYYPDVRFLTYDGKTAVVEVKSSYTVRCNIRENLRKFRSAHRRCEQSGERFFVAVVATDSIKWWSVSDYENFVDKL